MNPQTTTKRKVDLNPVLPGFGVKGGGVKADNTEFSKDVNNYYRRDSNTGELGSVNPEGSGEPSTDFLLSSFQVGPLPWSPEQF